MLKFSLVFASFFLLFCVITNAQEKKYPSQIWLEDSLGTKIEGTYNFSKSPKIQTTVKTDAIFNVKVLSDKPENKKAYVAYIMIHQFRGEKDVFSDESKDKTKIDLNLYKPEKRDIFVIQIALKDRTEKEFIFMTE